MRTTFFLIAMAASILATTAPARAAWVLLPIDGYDCPPGYDLRVIRSDDAVIDICTPAQQPLPAATAKASDEEQAASVPQGEEASDTERM